MDGFRVDFLYLISQISFLVWWFWISHLRKSSRSVTYNVSPISIASHLYNRADRRGRTLPCGATAGSADEAQGLGSTQREKQKASHNERRRANAGQLSS